MPLPTGHRQNFETLRRAFLAGDAALMECELASTGEAVTVLCAVEREPGAGLRLVPFAMLFNDNPYTLLNPPRTDGPGFHTQQEVWKGGGP